VRGGEKAIGKFRIIGIIRIIGILGIIGIIGKFRKYYSIFNIHYSIAKRRRLRLRFAP
jgi:hypothetical protein